MEGDEEKKLEMNDSLNIGANRQTVFGFLLWFAQGSYPSLYLYHLF
jgi:hypothetical protein